MSIAAGVTTGNTVRVACLGFVFDPVAQNIIRKVAPPEFELSFAEKPDSSAADLVAQSDMVLCVSHVTEPMIAKAPRLRMIHKWGIGVDKIDLVAAQRHGVFVAITAGANASVIAEHTVLLMLAVLRRVTVADRRVREGRWNPGELRPKSRQMAGKTVGIVGFGNIGRAVATLLCGFRTVILYHDPHRTPGEIDAATGARCVSLEELLAASDIITLHCPGGPDNRHLLDRKAIATMKPGAIIVNAARGELIAEDALVEALSNDHLLGAGLDTFEVEPLNPNSKLRGLDNVVLTPHSAGSVLDHIEPMAMHAFDNMQRLLRGERPRAADLVVDPAHPRFPLARAASA